jgi:hypothetical protein
VVTPVTKPLEFDDRQPAYRVFGVAFALCAALLTVVATNTARAAVFGRPTLLAGALVAAVLALSFARSPWRLRTVIEKGAVEHTAWRLVGSAVTRFSSREVEAIELVAKTPLRVFIVLRDGRRFEALRPWDRRGPIDGQKTHARPRAEALARALEAPLREA